ncbi:Trifunctional NAD biosynthesis/regulator protein NadR [Jeotgalicoccus saudimassiliensis]|uniref:Trifunctional NAD biosynthesis/regulator protein NadR n=1 Tax=Jeotgalicoccus saudimassiliensis TaxID=1461582 RepID=A0A078M272_9STAP|nr:AAA family ATPase [Jeotgalicoccus saudimassiliensis]CEA01468.1 Trifunctional NAD biosynthesis/regulator protein NadR [Jeotgalicoccus saudimassiliensis]
MRDLGIYFGTFAPCHVGHFEQIVRAKRENRHAVVIISGYDGDRGDSIGMNLEHRTRAMRQLLRNDSNVSILELNETDIPRYPTGWKPWLEMLESLIIQAIESLDFDVKSTAFYMGENEYLEPLESYFTDKWPAVDIHMTMVDRKILGISGTEIRETPILNWDYVTRPFRRFFVQNVLVTGSPNSGKSMIIEDLARRYSTSFSVEYAEDYFDEHQLKSPDLDAKDFHAIGIGQFELNRRHIHSNATRKVFFADTDVLYSKVHNMLSGHDGKEYVNQIFEHYIHLQSWSLILIMPPVPDASDYDKEFYRLLLSQLEHYGLMENAVILDDTYLHNYNRAHQLIDEILEDGKDN